MTAARRSRSTAFDLDLLADTGPRHRLTVEVAVLGDLGQRQPGQEPLLSQRPPNLNVAAVSG
jgi:hypothetical protein